MLFAIGFKKVRGVELYIIDAETGAPIPNICVYYYLTKSKVNIFTAGDFSDVIVVKEKFLSDENGIVQIKKRTIFLGLLQKLFSEKFYINIDINEVERDVDESYFFSLYFIENRNENSLVFFPIQEYYPAFVFNVYNDPDGFVSLQKSSSLIIRHDRALSDLMEKEDIVITIGLQRRSVERNVN